MRRESAEKVIKILLTADRGCIFCATELLNLFINEFPEYKELSRELFKNTFETDIELASEDRHNEKTEYKEISLHGWDDEKVYFWDGENEQCVSDEEELYRKIVNICKRYFKTHNKSKE